MCEEFFDLWRRFGIAVVLADTAGLFPWIERRITDFVYVRLHGSQQLYASGYTEEELDEWAARIQGWCGETDVTAIYLYFDNDFESNAGFDSLRLAELVHSAVAATDPAMSADRAVGQHSVHAPSAVDHLGDP